MKSNIIRIAAVSVMMSVAVSGVSASDKSSSGAADRLPEFNLKDPVGTSFTRRDIVSDGVVMVITAPILACKNSQESWAKHLKSAQKGSKGRLVFLQDLSVSLFKGKALNVMKKRSTPDADPLLLIDTRGSVRKKIGAPKKSTIVLVFDSEGKRVHEARGTASREGAEEVWGALNAR